jgi:hypothetical protein
MPDDRTLSQSIVTATIQAAIEKVNIADWLLHLPDVEYQRCSTAHIAGGSSTSDNGRPMSINVDFRFRLSGRPYETSGGLGAQRQEDRRTKLRVHQSCPLDRHRSNVGILEGAQHFF